MSVDTESGPGGAETRRWDEKIIQMACFVSEKDIWDGAGELGIHSIATILAGNPVAEVGPRVGSI